ncbi:hypothetical protein GND95_08600 [Defluviitalea raffinosedens]|uniref:Tail fiber protein n=1 Tax=Defluviitalea raffinosedens TaxID=1450156 RepID=A0A7C8HGC1_9FIRM|nr:tail fiber protein [Defluviitalea raffinosedens]KAE9633705.1 hypothetical protein GND95_08600 [Defluviitalea raffinosedens]
MATYTKNYNLVKPAQEDFYNVDDFNNNADKIDEALGNKVDKVEGKGLSTEDFTTEHKNALQNLSQGSISKSIFTAANQFLVSSGVGQVVAKTIADIKILLGLGSAAYKDSGSFANSQHSHLASDLPSASTSAKGIVQLSTSTSSTSTTLAATASAVKAAYDKATNHTHSISNLTDLRVSNGKLEYLVNGTWKEASGLININNNNLKRLNNGSISGKGWIVSVTGTLDIKIGANPYTATGINAYEIFIDDGRSEYIEISKDEEGTGLLSPIRFEKGVRCGQYVYVGYILD